MSHTQSNGFHASKGTDSQAQNSDDSLCSDDKFSLLANSRRRHAIRVLFEHERIDFGELVDKVAELEYQLPIEEISSDERHTIYVSLQQTHADVLEKNGILSRERDTGTISLGENADEVREYLVEDGGEKLPQEWVESCLSNTNKFDGYMVAAALITVSIVASAFKR